MASAARRQFQRDSMSSNSTAVQTNVLPSRPPITLTPKNRVRNLFLYAHMKPVRAVIRGKQDFLSAEFRAEVECEAEGSLPPALISWWLDGVRLNTSLTQTRLSAGGNVTTSLLGFVPRARDNGRQLRCVATNPRMPGHDQVADNWVLQVHYKPRVSLAWGNRVNRSSIMQGTDVYFECEVDANPRLIEVSWRFEGHELPSRISNFIVSNQSLALRGVRARTRATTRAWPPTQRVPRSPTGSSSGSNVLLLTDAFLSSHPPDAPVCASKQRSVHRAAKNDEVRIQCSVRAEPANVTFQWSLNASSGPRRELAWASAFGTDGLASSLLLYAPENESDYGTISCWARNAVGPASEPCLFEILPSGPPRAPQNCSVVRQVAGSLRVECATSAHHQPGVLYQLEVRERGRRLVANLSSVSPSFWVDALPAGSQCTLLVYAVGGSERSAPLKLSATVLANTAQGYSERGKRWAISTNLLLLLLVATGLVFVLLPFIVVIALRYRRKPTQPRGADEGAEEVDPTHESLLLNKALLHQRGPSSRGRAAMQRALAGQTRIDVVVNLRTA
ncbi:hypothetical protein HPB50_022449 [Hyalomma asiaticum]|uniref:Uncharacterized protein n=1 Tax=Hyalomma asiaticum TaxID=266040 RepID=A0ACB7TPD6_HYAAI|nr:hypothetical protein HPB50_022449 [Hyalomma asiaticum]